MNLILKDLRIVDQGSDPVTLADLVEVLEGLGAETLMADEMDDYPGLARLLVQPGRYLVLRVNGGGSALNAALLKRPGLVGRPPIGET